MQTFQSKDNEDSDDESEPLSAVQLALKRQQSQGPPPGFPALPQHAGTGVAEVEAASHVHLHMPFFEKVDIGRHSTVCLPCVPSTCCYDITALAVMT